MLASVLGGGSVFFLTGAGPAMTVVAVAAGGMRCYSFGMLAELLVMAVLIVVLAVPVLPTTHNMWL